MFRGLTFALALGAASLLAADTRAADTDSLNGSWEGSIVFDKETFLAETSTPTAGAVFRITIHDEVVHVFIKEPEGLQESMQGMFHVAAVSANAVIYGTQTLPDAPWVETWTFVVTQKDDNTLLVQYVRVVNNVGAPLSDPNSKFAARGAGEFKRMTS